MRTVSVYCVLSMMLALVALPNMGLAQATTPRGSQSDVLTPSPIASGQMQSSRVNEPAGPAVPSQTSPNVNTTATQTTYDTNTIIALVVGFVVLAGLIWYFASSDTSTPPRVPYRA
jgi:hypothetical protein